MKLRVKLDSRPTETQRVEIEASANLAQLQTQIASALSLTAAYVQLSLNKRDLLQDPSATLCSLGICGGDVVWVLTGGKATSTPTPSPPPAPLPSSVLPQASSTPLHESRTSTEPGVSGTMPHSTSSTSQQHMGGSSQLGGQLSKGAGNPTCSEEPEANIKKPRCGLDGGVDHNSGMAVDMTVDGEDAEEDPTSLTLPHEQQPSVPGQQHAGSSSVVPAHLNRVLQSYIAACGSKEGAGFQVPDSLVHDMLINVAHAVMLETGFDVRLDDTDADMGRSEESPSAPSVISHLQLPAQSLCCRMTYKLVIPSSTCCESARPLPHCCIRAVTMGSFLMLFAKVSVDGKDGSCSVLQSISLSTKQYLHESSTLKGRMEQKRSRAVEAATAALAPSLPALWPLLKEKLSMWLLSRCYQEAGLTPPVGLLMLPHEVKESILMCLKARDLASVSMVCSEMNHPSSADILWKDLYAAEFPNAGSSQAAAIGWRLAFSAKWIAREHQRLASRQPGMRMGPVFPPGPMSGGPFMPMGGTRYPPNIIGGNYDRFPQGMGMGGIGMGGGMGMSGMGGGGGMGMGGMGISMGRGPLMGPGPGFGRGPGQGGNPLGAPRRGRGQPPYM